MFRLDPGRQLPRDTAVDRPACERPPRARARSSAPLTRARNVLRGSIAESVSPKPLASSPPSEGHSPVSRTAQKPLIGPVVVRAPRLEPSLLVELIRIVDVGPAV